MSLYSEATYILTPNEYASSSLIALKPVDGSGDMFVDRSSYANRVNSSGLLEYMSNNIPRLDYSNGGCPSILVETQRTNINLYSKDLTNSFYNKYNSSISSNSTISPDGFTLADKVIENTSTSFHYVETTNALSSGQNYTISCFLKKAERTFGYIGVYTFESKQIRVNLSTGVIENTVGTWVSTSIEDYDDEWYRVIGTFSAGSTTYFFAGPSLDANTVSYAGNGTSGIYIYGVQLEQGSYATSYIPTESATVTRVFDSMTKTDIYNLVGVNQGTLFAEYKASVEGEVAKTISLYNTNSPNQTVYLNISATPGRIQGTLWNGSTSYTSFVTPVVQTDMNKIALIWGGGTMQLFVNNVAGNIVSTTGTFDGFNRLALNYFNGLFLPTGFVNSLMVWDRPLTISEIAQL